MAKNYTRAELTRLVDEFTAEFDNLVKSEVSKTGQALQKSEDGGSDKKESKPKEDSSSGGDSGSSGGDDKKAPPSGGDSSGGGDASAGGPPPPSDPGSAGGPPGGDPAAAGGVPPADPAAGAAGGDPVQALTQAYSQLSPEELQSHFFALQQVLQAQMGGGAGGAAPAPGAGAPPGADPMAASAGAPGPAAAGAPPAAPGGAGPAPMAGEGSKPVDPMASMAMKSMKDELDLVKGERDALKKSLTGLSETLEKLASKPQPKAIQATDAAVLSKSEQPKTLTMTRQQVLKKLAVVAANPDLKKSDRNLINKFCVGGVEVDAISHLLA